LEDSTTYLYIDFSLDTIYLEYSLDMPSFNIATRFLGLELERVRSFALDFEYCAFDLGSYMRLRSLTQIEEPILVIADSTVGQAFPFRFMFSHISDPPQGSFEHKLKEHGKLSHKSLF
jgi:hypothetical protein